MTSHLTDSAKCPEVKCILTAHQTGTGCAPRARSIPGPVAARPCGASLPFYKLNCHFSSLQNGKHMVDYVLPDQNENQSQTTPIWGDTEKPLPALRLRDDPYAPEEQVACQGLDGGCRLREQGHSTGGRAIGGRKSRRCTEVQVPAPTARWAPPQATQARGQARSLPPERAATNSQLAADSQ